MKLVLSEFALLILFIIVFIIYFPEYSIEKEDIVTLGFYLCGIVFDNIFSYTWKKHADKIFENCYHFYNIIPIAIVHCALFIVHTEFVSQTIYIKYIPLVSIMFAYGFLIIERFFLRLYHMKDDVRYQRFFPKIFPDDDLEE